MDDETEEGKTAETVTTLDVALPGENSSNITDEPPYGQVSGQVGKRKSAEIKTSRPRSTKNNDVLPPLLK